MSYDHEHAAMLATADPAGYDPASRTYSRCFPDVGEAFEAVRELEAAGNRGWISHRPDPPRGDRWAAPVRVDGPDSPAQPVTGLIYVSPRTVQPGVTWGYVSPR